MKNKTTTNLDRGGVLEELNLICRRPWVQPLSLNKNNATVYIKYVYKILCGCMHSFSWICILECYCCVIYDFLYLSFQNECFILHLAYIFEGSKKHSIPLLQIIPFPSVQSSLFSQNYIFIKVFLLTVWKTIINMYFPTVNILFEYQQLHGNR
jgi:hypothetical protein